MILRCLCPHEAQDRLHGFGHRVANPQKKQPEYARCTVCKTSILISGVMQTIAVTKAKKKKKK